MALGLSPISARPISGPLAEYPWFPLSGPLATKTRYSYPQPSWKPPPYRVLPNPAILPGSDPASRLPRLKLLVADPQSSVRTREFQQQVCDILNALLRKGRLVYLDAKDYDLGYVPGDQQDWAGTQPTTLWDALDRLAEADDSLGQTP